jgi:hypothetical protein
LLKISNLGWIGIVNQTTVHTNKKNTKTTYRPKGNNKVYHKDPNSWSYEIENKKVFQKIDKSKEN